MIDDAVALALSYSAQGLYVFPAAVCEREGRLEKWPLTAHGHKDASNDAEAIRTMFADAVVIPPAYKVVACCPGMSGHIVFDVDIKGGRRGDEVMAELEERLGPLPATPIVVTPSGGRHIWFRKRDESVRIGNYSPWPDIDVRSDDGWVVMPGSHYVRA